jgi:hypothetical protein
MRRKTMSKRDCITTFRATEVEGRLLRTLLARHRVESKSDYFRGLLVIDAEREGIDIRGVDIPRWAYPVLRGLVEDRAAQAGLRSMGVNRAKRPSLKRKPA